MWDPTGVWSAVVSRADLLVHWFNYIHRAF